MYANLSKEICIKDMEDLKVREKSTLSKENIRTMRFCIYC